MYFRIVKNIFSASTKFSKSKINKSTKFIFTTNLTVPRLFGCIDQFSVQNYSTNKQQLEKRFIDQESSNEASDTDDEYNLEQQDENSKQKPPPEPRHLHFIEKDQEKLDAMLKNNPELQRLKKIIELELIVLQQEGERVPSKLEPMHWCEILEYKSSLKRKKFYKYLFFNEKVNEKVKKEKEEKRLLLEQIRENRKNKPPSEGIVYGFNHNFMLRRISNIYMNHQSQWNALRAIMFGNKIVFDCSYDQFMSPLEVKSCAKQLNESYAANRIHNYPFEIFLTNVDCKSRMIDKLERLIPILYEPDFPITVTEKSYLELFDRSKLCYLTSNAPTMLEEYDPETIYIIGAFVDKGAKQPISFGKARREGIRMAKLPLDKYLHFGSSGGRDLTLNQMCNIMLDSQCKDWKEALKHVPTRKLHDSMIRQLENKIAKARERFQDDDSSDTAIKSSNDTTTSFKSYNSSFKSSNEILSSNDVHDFSHSARVKLRSKWSK